MVVVMQCRTVTVKIQAGCCRMKVRNGLIQPEQIDAAGRDGSTVRADGEGGAGGAGVLVRVAEREDPGSGRWVG